MFGLLDLWWNVYFVHTWTLVIPFNHLGCKTPCWAMWNAHPFLPMFFLDADIGTKDQQIEQGGLQDALRDFRAV